MIHSFSTLRITVADVAKSRDWYQAFLGKPPIEDLENFASFEVGGHRLDIALADEKSPISKGGSVGYWLTNDLSAAIHRAQQLGGRVYRGPLPVREINRTIVQIEDAYGNVFGIEAAIED